MVAWLEQEWKRAWPTTGQSVAAEAAWLGRCRELEVRLEQAWLDRSRWEQVVVVRLDGGR